MSRLITWLSERKTFTVISAGIYFTAAVLGHEIVSKISVWVEKKLTRIVYNDIISVIGVFLALIFSLSILNGIKRKDQKTLKVIYWFITTILVVISYRTLMVNNIESIHFVQYAVLALPVFALTKSFGETVFWITLLGAIDEAYQYFILYHNAKDIYFDFNDIVLNLLGGGIGIVLIYTLLGRDSMSSNLDKSSPENAFSNPPFAPFYKRGAGGLFGMMISFPGWRRTPFIITAGIISGSLVLYAFGLMQLYPAEATSKAPIILSRVSAPDQFWVKLEWGKTYHVLSPFAGTPLTAILIALYAFLDFKVDPKDGIPRQSERAGSKGSSPPE